ncbi:MAG: cobyrinate a,c-diamide synthase [Pseudobutyrivibrio sp.]|nr:cobyrinate a,c-diamide synthase [Pseudobutyrivibrio sp.]
MNCPRLIIAATGSGSGKTTITCGILSALKTKGLKPCSYKCGPDYIDPMFHRRALGITSGNLDTFFTDEEDTLRLFLDGFAGDIAVIEGVMGLYDGVGGVEMRGSTYDLASSLRAPIVLVIDARGKGRSVLAEIKGFLDYDINHLISGVILNKTSAMFAGTLAGLIEGELNIPVVGYVPTSKDVALDSRHLGLVLPEEIDDLNHMLDINEALVSQGIDLDKLISIAGKACTLDIPRSKVTNNMVDSKDVRIAVARDRAFCFYYRENLKMLEEAGVELVEFSPLEDERLPEGVSGLLLGGGYPENYLEELSANTSMKEDIRRAIKGGMPTLAECGGFMYLLDSIKDKDNRIYDMVGAIEGEAFWTGKLVRFGYVTIEGEGVSIKGHEFHYYDTTNNGVDMTAVKPATGRSYECMHANNNSYMGFAHLYYPSSPEFVFKFVEAMRIYGGH